MQMAAPKYSRVQEKGQITLPVDIRRKFGLQKSASTDHIEEMDRLLKEHGFTFQDLIDQMRDERPNLVNWDQESDPALQHE